MSYKADVLNVMIASPSDVANERNIIREVTYEWNTVHSLRNKIVLLPVGWESHVYPTMGDKPQTIINKQIVDKCDILIGVFWTKIGTPTDDYASGSVEEILRHMESGKQTMIYFSNKPVVMGSVDNEQYNKLQEFKELCKNKGIYGEYGELGEFRDKLYREIQLYLNDQSSGTTAQTVPSSIQTPQLTDSAQILLKEASIDSTGTIMYLKYLSGIAIQTNRKNFIEENNPREEAKWISALEELEKKGLINASSPKREIFKLTSLGYQVADIIEI